MTITEVRIYQKEPQEKKLRAYSTITFDGCFVVRDIKIIEGSKGLFVAMPSRRVKSPCPKCRHQNISRSRYCNQCGASLPALKSDETQHEYDPSARQNEHKDVAHPITAEFRAYIQSEVLKAYELEKGSLKSAESAG